MVWSRGAGRRKFSGDCLVVTAIGQNIHPSIGKGRMINAVRGLAQFISRMPVDKLSPESTEGREGFLHPYSITGSVGSAELRILLRDFETSRLDEYERLARNWASQVEADMPGLKLEVVRKLQYRNMADALAKQPLMMDLAERAFEQLGRPCLRGSIRGGTDGAMFSECGLPTPNLSVVNTTFTACWSLFRWTK